MRRWWLVPLAVSGVAFAGGGITARAVARGRLDRRERDARILQRAVAVIRDDYVDPIAGDSLYLRATKGLVTSLHDPYAELLMADAYRRFNQQLSGTRIELAPSSPRVGGALTGDSPLFSGGAIAPGDRILAVDGRSLAGLSDADATRLVASDTASVVTLLIQPPDGSSPVLRRVARTEVHVPAVSPGVLLRDGVGYVALHTVSQDAAIELRAAVDALRRRGMRSLILDLRRNPGGLINQGVEIASLFLPGGDTVAVMRGREGTRSRVHLSEGNEAWPGMPLALLVNRQTASSAEVIAAALQDHDRALVVGSSTYGKGVIQTTFPLAPDVAIKFTTARWYAPSGRSIQRSDTLAAAGDVFRSASGRPLPANQGVTPDVPARARWSSSEDLAFVRQVRQKPSSFREALDEAAGRIAAIAPPTRPDFAVSAEMREVLWRAFASHSVPVSRSVFDAATPLVSRELGYAIARAHWGDRAELFRRTTNDRVVGTALTLLSQVSNQAALIALAGNPLAAR